MADDARATCSATDDAATIGNRWLRRTFRLKEGCASTAFDIRPWGSGTWLPAFGFVGAYPLEAEVVLNGRRLRVGPWRHEHYGHECDWECTGHAIEETPKGVRLDIRLRLRKRNPLVELVLHQEVAHDAPFLKRWVTLANSGTASLVLERMVVEVLPVLRVDRQIQVIDAYVKPKVFPSPDFVTWQLHEFEHGPDVRLAPGESFESFTVYTLVSADGVEERLAAVNAMLRAEAPWTTHPILCHQFGRVAPWKDILDLGKRSSAQGFEALVSFVGVHFTNTGDFALNPKVFPKGESDFKRLVEGLHKMGMKFIVYVGFCIAGRGSKVRESHLDWEMIGPEGRPYDPGSIGNMCPSSGWGDFLLDRCRWLVDKIGVDGLQTDGPYYGQPCHQTGHHHATPGEAQYRNWRYEMDFYREMQQKGKIIETPTGLYALLNGATSLPQGYHEEDASRLALFDLVTAFRSRLYTGQMRGLPGWAAWGFAMIDPYHGHGIWPPEEHLVEFEHLIAGHLGYGLSAFFHGWDLANGQHSEEILRKWLNFFKKHRQTLAGDAVFLEAPTGFRPDAILHTRPGAETPAILVAFNPTDRRVRVHWSVPLWRAGITSGQVYVVPDGRTAQASNRRLDDVGNLALPADFAPYQIRWWEYRGR